MPSQASRMLAPRVLAFAYRVSHGGAVPWITRHAEDRPGVVQSHRNQDPEHEARDARAAERAGKDVGGVVQPEYHP